MKRLLCALLIVALAVTAGMCARRWLLSLERIAGSSMSGTLRSGDVVLVTRWDALGKSFPSRGDVALCRFPGRDGSYVKRIAGLPGDSVVFTGGTLTLNGQPVSEPYVSSPTDDYAVVLGPDEYLALGDNRAESYDSRSAGMGCIARSDLLGRVRWILWPPSRFGPVE